MKSFHPFRLDEANQCLWRGDTRVSLMPKPFAVLQYLVDHAGRLITHDELMNAIWPDTFVQPEVLRRYILEIRKALGDQAGTPRFIQTRPKLGYQFIAPVMNDDPTRIAAPEATALPRLVGRDTALAELRRYLTIALGGKRQIAFVVGEPGIGKTSLVDAFQREAATRPGVSIARGQSLEGFAGKEPYYPIFEALGQLSRGDSSALVLDALASNAPTWLIQFPSLVRADLRADLLRQTAGATRERMVRELCEALERITRERALVLVLEDLHWADHSTIDLMSAIGRRREPARLLIVGTIRPADLILSESPLKALKQDLVVHRLAHELALDPLSESDVAAYLAAEFNDDEALGELTALVYRQSDGNPLFMTAMLDHLTQQGVLSRELGRWRLTTPIERINPGVPETLKQMLELQMQHLSDRQRQLLKCASVAGQRFTAWSLATMLVTDVSEPEDACALLAERQQVVKFSGTRDLSEQLSTTAYEFRHSLYRDVLYRALNPALRVTYHRRLADGLEQLRSPVDPELAAELALHCEEGREYARAIRHLMLAAHNATRRYAHDEAIAVFEHARELLPNVSNDERAQLELQILHQMGNVFYALGSIDRSADTYRLLASRAAAAGLLAAQADALLRLPHAAASIPFFLRALEIQPTFAAAHVNLSRIYSNLGEAAEARQFAKRAYDLLGNVGERDRLSILYQYHFEVTGNQLHATDTLERWKATFPDEYEPVNSLAHIHILLGRFERAIAEGHQAIERNPSHGYPYSNLAHAYRGIGRLVEAGRVAHEAVARGIETLPTRRLLYQLAIINGDEAAAAAHVQWARDKPREFDMVGARAQVLAWSGRVREARRAFTQCERMATSLDLAESSHSYLAWATWMELTYGNTAKARHDAECLLERNPGYDVRLRAALTLALCGGADQAEVIAEELTASNPEHTFINSVLAPLVRAGVALDRKRPDRAIEQLEPVRPYELGLVAWLVPVYLRARSFLSLGSAKLAAEEFQRLVDHRGVDPFSPFHAVAPMGLARARAMAGDIEGNRQAYEEFLARWATADDDIPVLQEARREYGFPAR